MRTTLNTVRRVALANHAPSLQLLAGALLVLGLLACGATTRTDYHRVTLEPFARQRLDCEHGPFTVSDVTPEGFFYGRDYEAGRYDVNACGREASFVCFTVSESTVASAPECRRLGEAPSRVYIGDRPVL